MLEEIDVMLIGAGSGLPVEMSDTVGENEISVTGS